MSEAVGQLSVHSENESLDYTDAIQMQDEHAAKKATKAQRRKVAALAFLSVVFPI